MKITFLLHILGKLTSGLGNTIIGHTTADTLHLFRQIDEAAASPGLICAAGFSEKNGTDHSHRWFEVDASKRGAKHFDKKYGSGAFGYTERNKNYFDKGSFETGRSSLYTNPRTGKFNDSMNPTSGSKIVFLDYLIFL